MLQEQQITPTQSKTILVMTKKPILFILAKLVLACKMFDGGGGFSIIAETPLYMEMFIQ